MQSEKLLLPSNIEAEQAVIGAMMIDEESIILASERLKQADFETESHKTIFQTILELNINSKPVTPITLKNALQKKELLDKCGGASYLHTLNAQGVATATLSHYAGIVKEMSYLRQFIQITSEAVVVAKSYPEEPHSLSAKIQGMLYELDQQQLSQKKRTLFDIQTEAIEDIEKAREGKKGGIDTGFKNIDSILTGMYPGDLVLLAARPMMGKTAMALNIAWKTINKLIPAVIISLEMGGSQLLQRLYSQACSIDSYRMRTGNISDEDMDKISEVDHKLIDLPLFIDDRAELNMIDIKGIVRNHFRKCNRSGLAIIDYLQLITPYKAKDNRENEISDISRSLKLLAKELSCVVISLSQLSRANEYRSDKMPQLSDLRGSGSLEQDADVVMFIHRAVNDDEEEKRAETQLNIAKHRKGSTGICKLHYDERYTRFHDVTNKAIDDDVPF